MSFEVDEDHTYEAEVEAIVWDMPGIDFILVLLDIVKRYMELLISDNRKRAELHELNK